MVSVEAFGIEEDTVLLDHLDILDIEDHLCLQGDQVEYMVIIVVMVRCMVLATLDHIMVALVWEDPMEVTVGITEDQVVTDNI